MDVQLGRMLGPKLSIRLLRKANLGLPHLTSKLESHSTRHSSQDKWATTAKKLQSLGDRDYKAPDITIAVAGI